MNRRKGRFSAARGDMHGLEFIAEHDRSRGLIIPGDAFHEHPGPPVTPMCRSGSRTTVTAAGDREPFLPRRPLGFAVGSLTCHDE